MRASANNVLVLIGLAMVVLSQQSTIANPLHNSSALFYSRVYDHQHNVEDDEASHISFYYKPSHQHNAHEEISNLNSLGRLTPAAYNSMREVLFRYEESKAFGSDIHLNKLESQANEIIMAAKMAEFNEGLVAPHLFNPSKHFFSVLESISKSNLFAILSKMPKGAVLHAHDTALCSTEFIIKLTYRPNLWMCSTNGGAEGVALKFSKQRPTEKASTECSWELLSSIRQRRGYEAVDKYLHERFSMYPIEKFLDVNEAWVKFLSIFGLLDGLVTYAPVWADYYYNALTEFYADGVQYLEFRSTLPTLYDMDGNVYTQLDTVRVYWETLQLFKKNNLGFIGSRMIFAPLRDVDSDTVDQYIRTCIEIQAKYPEFVAGFDLVGQEEKGHPLKDFIPQLLSMPDYIDFYFHAGETNWYGSSVDENLIDAILLGTKRIGHGFGILKHPVAMQLIKERNIPIEINPISNQVLTLLSDYRNHPCAHLFSNNYTVVISSDDPSFWKASPLSHDFYIAFLGIASAHSDLRLLKKLAINSIQYSSMNNVEKADGLIKWEMKWNQFIESIINGVDSSAASDRRTGRLRQFD